MDINERLDKIRSYISENSDIDTDVDVSYAKSLETDIVNSEDPSEDPSEDFDLFNNSNNSHIALSILDL
jgi:hypothetical protein